MLLKVATGPAPALPAHALQPCHPVFESMFEMVVLPKAADATNPKPANTASRTKRENDWDCNAVLLDWIALTNKKLMNDVHLAHRTRAFSNGCNDLSGASTLLQWVR
ncbi:MAG: hypothetical protein HYX28_02200 [Candidatus Koribacter versatilis]|uniref:Uncharacterized protein n=1 Tax=Candidatus Korobacter versatilis TaxID=658062 RepID=A0A932EQ14_9BACT|nr:hypothetical protein [Candidatus Koribacter versatilis]